MPDIPSLSKSPSLSSVLLVAYPSTLSPHDSIENNPNPSNPSSSPSLSKYQVVGSIQDPSSQTAPEL